MPDGSYPRNLNIIPTKAAGYGRVDATVNRPQVFTDL